MNASITITGTPRKTRDQESVLKILESNWQAEMGGYHTYETLSERENDPQRRSALRGLAYAEKHHADLWSDRIAALGGPQPAYNGRETGEAAHQFQQEDERVHEDDAVVTTGKVLGLRDASDKGIIPPMWSSSISPRRTSSSRKMSP